MSKILIVDDSNDLQEIMSIIIKMHGDEPVSLLSADGLIAQLEDHKPDLLILDVLLNGYNGRELCLEIKSNPRTKHIPIILISASTPLLKDYEACMADDIIEKPFDISTVSEKIDKILVRV